MACALVVVASGCSRAFYRRQADQDVYSIYAEKRCEEAYTIPPLPRIDVDPRSRFFDPSPEDCPALPFPEPQLYGYELPSLATGNPFAAPLSQTSPKTESSAPNTDGASAAESIVAPEGVPSKDIQSLPLPSDSDRNRPAERPEASGSEAVAPSPFSNNSPRLDAPLTSAPVGSPELEFANYLNSDRPHAEDFNQQVAELREVTEQNQEVQLAELLNQFVQQNKQTDDNGETASPDPSRRSSEAAQGDEEDLRIVPIPAEFWEQLPESCLRRMLEFDSVRQEFRRTFKSETDARIAELRSTAPRLTLPMIAELSTFNNRDLQTQKENLYRAALILSAQRYEYLLRPTRRGNGTGASFDYIRADSTSRTGMAIPSGVAVTRTTATAGQFLSSFANDVVLTFNGPQGFSANIASELLFDFQQTIFQRDIVFENLTSAERNVIYAARDYIQFQRALFVELAGRYYRLLLTYRQIEISSQDYFSNLRAFLQGRAEFLQAGRIPRVQVDQFEQNALSSSSSLVRDCNSLETSLDNLKLDVGVPPEMALNIDLEELETLTASDALTVTRQLVMRKKLSLLDAEGAQISDRNAAVNGAIVLIRRLEEAMQARREIEGEAGSTPTEQLTPLLTEKLALLEARLQSDTLKQDRSQLLKTDPPAATEFFRTVDLIESELYQIKRAIYYDSMLSEHQVDVRSPVEQITRDQESLQDLVQQWKDAEAAQDFDRLDELVLSVNGLLESTEQLITRFVDPVLPRDPDELNAVIESTISESIALVDQVETDDVAGLDPVDIETDEAMLLALYQRLDLANQRGDLADARRQIKLAADDLKSILNVNASHRLFTDRNILNDFETSGDGSTTSLSFSLDTPLNRRLERNFYRVALIQYNRSRRELIDREDSIKFEIREDLRQLRLRRNQFEISVARAALAYERVVSTRLQLQLSVGNVVARDFLEAQQAFTEALNSVASNHISFVLDRIELFNDTESIRLNEYGYWENAGDDTVELPPLPDFYDANPNPYGRLPDCLKYSEEVRQNH
ncbi:TolC family protein [Roseiconus lacunae]|uniref:TolC family protein n=1 Tax=Roseiconus lacunae TaxID=2605694 RepID=UPI0011F26309|nr:TolC family protein [Roseiconus lacunae]